MNASQRAHHDDVVRFLEEQMELSEGTPVRIFEPVIQLNKEAISIGQGSRIDSFCKLEGGDGLRIGCFVHIASFVHLGIGGGELVIGDYAAVASGARVITGSNQTEALSMSACAPKDIQIVRKSKTTISRYAVVLAGATVLPGVTLHEGAILAAGGVATKDIPAWEIWGGVPARFMSKRVRV
jgi:acetyltransferase-like isoleucine patch superfamily enzyme